VDIPAEIKEDNENILEKKKDILYIDIPAEIKKKTRKRTWRYNQFVFQVFSRNRKNSGGNQIIRKKKQKNN
jgi:hypothetical protein